MIWLIGFVFSKIFTQIFTDNYLYTFTHTHIHIHTHTHTHSHTHTYTYTHTHTQKCLKIKTYTNTHIWLSFFVSNSLWKITQKKSLLNIWLKLSIWIFIDYAATKFKSHIFHIHTNTHTHIYRQTDMHTQTHTHTYTHTHIHTYTSLHTYTKTKDTHI